MGNLLMLKNSIVIVPFPFDDFSSIKVRPALCLTSSIGVHKHIIIAFISSKIPSRLGKYELKLDSNLSGWAEMGLHIESVIKIHKMVTIPQSLIKRKLGKIGKEVQQEVRAKIDLLFNQS
ncbi:MAG: type II toxin-antitoxin system PemK/MazF family toxin [Cyclobacteriaceae bacterium]|nr:type II toxin-antitoxin system PemK/MazF family toxin [Cyclobacteriaceae bacterium]